MDYFCKHCLTLDPQGISGHRCKPAINTDAINKAINATSVSSHVRKLESHASGVESLAKSSLSVNRRGQGASSVECAPKTAGEGLQAKTANRRSKADYNAYMREYMRKKRASHQLDGSLVRRPPPD